MKRRNRKLRKALLMLCCALALVAISVGATLAYLTDTEAVTNTFTVGHVDISLDEAKVGADGKEITGDDAQRVQKNEYKLLPGMTYDKDPTIHLTADTLTVDYQDAYVVAEVTVSKAQNLLSLLPADTGTIGIKNIVTGGVLNETYTGPSSADGVYRWENDTAILTQTTDKNDNIIFMVYWKEPKTPGTDLTIFENLIIPQNWDNEEIAKLQGMTIDVNAYAIQAAGFDDVEAAFAAGDWD